MLEFEQPEKADEHSFHPTSIAKHAHFDQEKFADEMYEFRDEVLYSVRLADLLTIMLIESSEEALVAVENFCRKNGVKAFVQRVANSIITDWDSCAMEVVKNIALEEMQND